MKRRESAFILRRAARRRWAWSFILSDRGRLPRQAQSAKPTDRHDSLSFSPFFLSLSLSFFTVVYPINLRLFSSLEYLLAYLASSVAFAARTADLLARLIIVISSGSRRRSRPSISARVRQCGHSGEETEEWRGKKEVACPKEQEKEEDQEEVWSKEESALTQKNTWPLTDAFIYKTYRRYAHRLRSPLEDVPGLAGDYVFRKLTWFVCRLR